MKQFQGSTALHTKILLLRKIQLSDTEAMFRTDCGTMEMVAMH